MAITRPYTAQEWETGDIITKEKINNIEDALEAIDSEITGARGSGSSVGTLGKRIDDLVMVQDTQPTSEANEIWVRSTGNGVQVPTYEEFETLRSNFAGTFNTSTSYITGQYVIYTDNNFYRFTTDHAAGAWNSAHVVQVTAGGELADLKSAIIAEFTDYTFTNGYLIKAIDGSRTSHSDHSAVLEYIPISTHGIIGIHAYWSGAEGVAFYDDALEYIGGYNSSIISSGEHTFFFNVPAGAFYMRFSNNSYYLDNANVKVYEYAPQIEKNSIKSKIADDNAQLYSIVNYNIMPTVSKHTGFCNHNGTIDRTATSYRYTDPIPVTPGETLYGTTMRFATFFNSRMAYSSGINNPGETFSVPTGSAYVRVTYNNDLIPYPFLSKSNTTEFFTDQAREEIKKATSSDVFGDKLKSILYGKKIATFGDSIMYGDGNSNIGPANMIATKYNMTLYKYAVSGATMGVLDASHSHIPDQIQLAISAGVTPDIIIFDGGTNDMNGTNPNCPLGDVTDVYAAPSSESTFSAGFETAAYKLKTAFPNALIIYVRTGNISGRRYDRQIEYGERGIAICHKWGIIVADVYNILNTNLSQYSGYMNDATHPNGNGYTYFYIPEIERQILRWFSTYPNS